MRAVLSGLFAVVVGVGVGVGVGIAFWSGLVWRTPGNPESPQQSDLFCEYVPLERCTVTRVTNVKRITTAVTENGQVHYVFWTLDDRTNELRLHAIASTDTRVLLDLADDKPIVIEMLHQQHFRRDPESRLVRGATIHLRSLKDLE